MQQFDGPLFGPVGDTSHEVLDRSSSFLSPRTGLSFASHLPSSFLLFLKNSNDSILVLVMALLVYFALIGSDARRLRSGHDFTCKCYVQCCDMVFACVTIRWLVWWVGKLSQCWGDPFIHFPLSTFLFDYGGWWWGAFSGYPMIAGLLFLSLFSLIEPLHSKPTVSLCALWSPWVYNQQGS